MREIETRENIRILYCAEAGSRAWGVASPDSDYDVRFIYLRPLEYYLRLDKTRDVIEWLLHASNATLFEWNRSPIVYKTTPEWKKISAVIEHFFQEKAGLYHYLSMAKKNYREYLKGDRVRVKKYFYVLRPVLACRWILEKQTPPPMLFSELANAFLDGKVASAVNELLRLKMETSELGLAPRIEVINEYLDASIEEIDQRIQAIPSSKNAAWDELNTLFLKVIGLEG